MTAKRSQSPKLGCPPVWVGLQTSHVLGLVICTQSRAHSGPQLSAPSCFSSAFPLPLQRPGKRRLRPGRAGPGRPASSPIAAAQLGGRGGRCWRTRCPHHTGLGGQDGEAGMAPGWIGGKSTRASLITLSSSSAVGVTPCPVCSSLEWPLPPLAQSLCTPFP